MAPGLLEFPKYVATDEDLPEIFGTPTSTPPSPVYNFELQAARWLEGLRTRDCDPVAPSTLATFESRVKTILSVVGPWTKLEDFRNAAMAKFVQDAKRFKWAPSTVADHILVIKLIISSAIDAEGEELFARTWNRRVINAPRVERSKQKTPTLTTDDVEKFIREADTEQDKIFYAFLPGSGLRISEAQAVRVSGNLLQTSWDREQSTIAVRTGCFRNRETGRTKTSAGQRTVFLHSELNQALIVFADREKREPGSFLFQSKPGQPIRLSTVRERMAKRIPGAAPHAARRFYISWLRKCRVLEEIIRGQVGHAAESITDIYSFQDENTVRAAIEVAGLGFKLENTL
jgi:integrase